MAESPGAPPSLAERFPALSRLGSRLRRRRLTFVAQVTSADCAAACLSMVLRYWGREASLDEVQRATGLMNLNGVSARALLEAGRGYGLTGRAAQLEDVEGLRLLPVGSVLHWEFRHFVVFEAVTRRGVQVLDPAFGRRFLSMEHFRKSFTGIVLLFEPSETFETGVAARGPSRYLRSVLEARPVLGRVFAMSLLLQFFALALPSLTGALVDFVIPTGDAPMLGILGAGMAVLLLFQFLTSMVRAHLLLHLRTHLDARLTVGFLDHLVHLPFSFFSLRSSGDLLARLNSNTTVRELLTSGALSAVLDGMLASLYLLLLLVMNWKLGLLAVGLGLAQVLVFVLTRDRQRELMSRDLEVSATARGFEVELMTGIQTIKGMGVEARSVQSWSNLYVDTLNVSLERGRMDALVESLTNMLRLGSPLVLLLVGTYQVLQGHLRLGEMLALNALAVGFLVPVANLVTASLRLQLVGTYLERVDDVLEAPLEQPPGTPRRRLDFQGKVEFNNVSFRYGPLTAPVVQEVSLTITPGQFVAIVGRSGAGKSTLAHLLLGLYLPSSGSIYYDDVSQAELDLYELRRRMGVVQQSPILFRGDIRRNIAYVDPSVPLESVIASAKWAQIHDDIMAMPMQYDTLLSEQGSSVSGGQRQRIALARALVCDPAILLLDEATNALDVKTERAVQHALAELRCTRVVIAHRLSTIENADVILVMDKGRLVEKGTHTELMARRGHYYELVATQVQGDDGLAA